MLFSDVFGHSLWRLHRESPKTYEQRHFYADKAKTEVRHFLSEIPQPEIHACKARQETTSPKSPRNGQLQNEMQ